MRETPCPREHDADHDPRGDDDDFYLDDETFDPPEIEPCTQPCEHDWIEQSGEPARDVCFNCGEER